MGKYIEEKTDKVELDYYYDSHSTEEDLMPESVIHRWLTEYLTAVLKWLFRGQRCAIYENINVYQIPDELVHPIVAPDIAVIKGVDYEWITSWKMPLTQQAPHIVFEIASKETWQSDVENKPNTYAQLGVQEYFFYDPDKFGSRKLAGRQLLGWRLNPAMSDMQELLLDERGRLWSEQLDSWLMPDDKFLRLHDRVMQRRLTEAEALAQRLRELGVNPDEL